MGGGRAVSEVFDTGDDDDTGDDEDVGDERSGLGGA
jgi:hypothetical protein